MARFSRVRVVLLASALSVLSLSSCAANQGAPFPGSAPGGDRGVVGEPLPAEDGGSEEAPVDGEDRDVVVTADVVLADIDPLSVADEVQEIVEDAGGRVDQRSDSPGSAAETAHAELVLRIPSDELDDSLERLSELATVVSSTIDRRDVTGAVADVSARIGALDASIDRLLGLLSTAGAASDLITIESELTTRQAERDSLLAQQKSLADRVDFSTVSVSVGVPGEVTGTGPADFWSGLVLGFQSLVGFLGTVLVLIGVLVPWLLLLAAIGLIVWALRRRRRSRRPNGNTDVPGPREPGTGPGSPPGDASGASQGPPIAGPAARTAWTTPDPAVPIPPRPPLPAPRDGVPASPTAETPADTAPADTIPTGTISADGTPSDGTLPDGTHPGEAPTGPDTTRGESTEPSPSPAPSPTPPPSPTPGPSPTLPPSPTPAPRTSKPRASTARPATPRATKPRTPRPKKDGE
jgi:hypothetical protein